MVTRLTVKYGAHIPIPFRFRKDAPNFWRLFCFRYNLSNISKEDFNSHVYTNFPVMVTVLFLWWTEQVLMELENKKTDQRYSMISIPTELYDICTDFRSDMKPVFETRGRKLGDAEGTETKDAPMNETNLSYFEPLVKLSICDDVSVFGHCKSVIAGNVGFVDTVAKYNYKYTYDKHPDSLVQEKILSLEQFLEGYLFPASQQDVFPAFTKHLDEMLGRVPNGGWTALKELFVIVDDKKNKTKTVCTPPFATTAVDKYMGKNTNHAKSILSTIKQLLGYEGNSAVNAVVVDDDGGPAVASSKKAGVTATTAPATAPAPAPSNSSQLGVSGVTHSVSPPPSVLPAGATAAASNPSLPGLTALAGAAAVLGDVAQRLSTSLDGGQRKENTLGAISTGTTGATGLATTGPTASTAGHHSTQPGDASSNVGAQGNASAVDQEDVVAATPRPKRKRRSRGDDDSEGDSGRAKRKPRKKKAQEDEEEEQGEDSNDDREDSEDTEALLSRARKGQQSSGNGTDASASRITGDQISGSGNAVGAANAANDNNPSAFTSAAASVGGGVLSERIPRKQQTPLTPGSPGQPDNPRTPRSPRAPRSPRKAPSPGTYFKVIEDAINCVPGGKLQWTQFACDSDIKGILSHHRFDAGEFRFDFDRLLSDMRQYFLVDIAKNTSGGPLVVWTGYGSGAELDPSTLLLRLHQCLCKHENTMNLNGDLFMSMMHVLVINIWSEALIMAWHVYDSPLGESYKGAATQIAICSIGQIILSLDSGRRYVFELVYQSYLKGKHNNRMVVLMEMIQNALFSLVESDLPNQPDPGEEVKPDINMPDFLPGDLSIMYDLGIGDSVVGYDDSVSTDRPFTQDPNFCGGIADGVMDNMSTAITSQVFGNGSGESTQEPSGSGDIGLPVPPDVAGRSDSNTMAMDGAVVTNSKGNDSSQVANSKSSE